MLKKMIAKWKALVTTLRSAGECLPPDSAFGQRLHDVAFSYEQCWAELEQAVANSIVLRRVLFAHECAPCPGCEEPICPRCAIHYGECNCPGPSQDDLYDYVEIRGVLYAAAKITEEE